MSWAGKHLMVAFESLRQARVEERARRQSDNTEFLPGALEVIETPPNPLGRGVLWLILFILAATIVWCCFGTIDVIAVASGRVIPDGRIKIVQAPDEGVVRAIHVSEGEHVRQGQTLLEMDPTISGAEAEQARSALLAAEVDRARAQALLDYANKRERRLALPGGADEEVAGTQAAMVRARIAEYESYREAAAQDLAEKGQDRALAIAEIARVEQTLPLMEDQLGSLRTLETKGFAARLRVSDVEQKTIDMRQDLVRAKQQALKSEAAERQARQQLAGIDERFRRETLDAFNEADSNVRIRREQLTITQSKNQRQQLTAPATGVVQQLQVHTVGAVVKPADSLLVIVPEGSKLVIDAKILNRDVGFVREGQEARVKFEAFPFTRYGVLNARIAFLGHDAVQDEKLGLVYPARAELSGFVLKTKDGEALPISPGMNVTAEIRTGQRRIIEFLLSPISKSVQEAAHER